MSLLVSCVGPEPQRTPAAASAPAPQNPSAATPTPLSDLLLSYSLTDTTDWGDSFEQGKRAVLRRAGEIVDTVDLEFGFLVVGRDSLVFLPIRTDSAELRLPIGGDSVTPPDTSYGYHESSRTEHVLWTPSLTRKLAAVLPSFHTFFSSPTVADKATIAYWGFAPDSGQLRVYAMRYDFRSAHLDSLFLRREPGNAGTDYRWGYAVPEIKGKEISFDGVVLDRVTWRVIRRDSSHN